MRRGESTLTRDDHADVFLTPRQSSAAQAPISWKKIVAEGNVVLQEPERKRPRTMVYTGSDSKYVLTGSPGVLPRHF